MWAKRSEMLVPLSDLVGECGETKTTKKNKTKKKRDPIHQKAFDNVKATICKTSMKLYWGDMYYWCYWFHYRVGAQNKW
jgi:hypothetical protein